MVWERSVSWLLVWVLLAGVLAGCAGNGDKAGEGSGLQVEGSLVDSIKVGEGAVRGTVTDDLGISLPGSKVGLMGTTHLAITGNNGSFLFTNITVGSYKLFAQHPDHHELQDTLQVESGKLLDVKVVLLPLKAAGAGYRSHIHDYWGGDTVKTVIDGTAFEYHEPYDDSGPYAETFGRAYDTATASVVHPCVCCTDYRDQIYFNTRLIWFDEPEQLVWAGTGRIEVIIDWEVTDYPYHTDYAFAWTGANSTTYEESPLIQKGEPYFIDVPPDEWDSSHQGFSLWELYVCLDTREIFDDVPRLFLGSFRATVKLHRMDGPIPFEQPHPVFWPESGQMEVVAGDERTINGPYYESRSTFNSPFVVRPDEGAMVPPGTKYLEARLEWSYGGPAPDPKAWSLTYRPADVRFWDMKDPGEMLKGTVVEEGSDFREYEIELQPSNTDQFYQKKSNWFFMLNLEGEEDDWKYVSPCWCPVDLKLSVLARQDQDFQEG